MRFEHAEGQTMKMEAHRRGRFGDRDWEDAQGFFRAIVPPLKGGLLSGRMIGRLDNSVIDIIKTCPAVWHRASIV